MPRSLKLASVMIVLASLVCALAALALRWREAGDLAAIFAGPRPVRPLIILATPFAIAGLLAFADRAMNRPPAHMTAQGRWFVGFSMLTHVALLVAVQAWMIATYLGSARPDPEFVTRLACAFMGLAMAVRANFFAKLRGPDADAAGDWARTTRRSAIALTLTGLSLALSAVTLPMPALIAALAAVFALVLALSRVQRRAAAQL